jgi:hypothetical protein
MAKAESFIIYRGPSLIDGEPIVAIAQVSSRNAKTGSMVQTFIMRADMDPITANRTGADHAICGTCPHRGKAHDGDKGPKIAPATSPWPMAHCRSGKACSVVSTLTR